MCLIYFAHEGAAFDLDFCCLFPQYIHGVVPLIVGVQVYGLHVLPGRWRKWVAPVGGNCLPGPWHWQGPLIRGWLQQATPDCWALVSDSDIHGGGSMP